jgi:GNAT superfamily N-acetyltransferase
VIRVLAPQEIDSRADALAEVLLDAVAGGASVSFMAGLTRDQAVAWWREIAASAARGERVVFVAGEFDGTAQLVLDTPPNQPHRAELAKMLVHRRARRRGLGRALFAAVEEEARKRQRTLLTFDTLTGSAAERLYLECGAERAGVIPGYALFPEGGAPAATTVFFKRL